MEGIGGGQVIAQLRDDFRGGCRQLPLGHSLHMPARRGLVQRIHRAPGYLCTRNQATSDCAAAGGTLWPARASWACESASAAEKPKSATISMHGALE